MLNTLVSIATIAGFIVYIFIEWPKIQNRWKETYPSFERLLIVISIISGFLALIPLSLSVFIKSHALGLLSAGFTLFGFSMLIGYWIENKTLVYRQESQMSSIWLIIVTMFIVGVIGLLYYWFGRWWIHGCDTRMSRNTRWSKRRTKPKQNNMQKPHWNSPIAMVRRIITRWRMMKPLPCWNV